jgi:hypothetical protein
MPLGSTLSCHCCKFDASLTPVAPRHTKRFAAKAMEETMLDGIAIGASRACVASGSQRLRRTPLDATPPLIIEIFVWLGVLAIAPLTVAAPIASLNYIGVILVSR